MADELGKTVLQKNLYADYKAIIAAVNEADRPLSLEYCRHQAEKHGFDDQTSRDVYKNRVKDLYDWNIKVFDWIVGQYPRNETWVDINANRVGAEEVTSNTVNAVQRACVTSGDKMRERYAEASIREFQARALRQSINAEDVPNGLGPFIDEAIQTAFDNGDIPEDLGQLVDDVMADVARYCADELPPRIEAVEQGSKSIAGDANEELAVRCLNDVDYTVGARADGHEIQTDTDDADIILHADPVDLYIEVKSTASRERVGRALMDDEHPWVLFGFLDEPDEVRSRMFTGNQQGNMWTNSTLAAYLPPRTLARVKDLDEDRDDSRSAYTFESDQGLYLRSNEEFAADMQHYRNTGNLRDLEPGHENVTDEE